MHAMHAQVRGAELEAELDCMREDANSRISQLPESSDEQRRMGQQQLLLYSCVFPLLQSCTEQPCTHRYGVLS